VHDVYVCAIDTGSSESDCSIPRRSYMIHHWYIIHMRQDRFVASVYRTSRVSCHKVVEKG